MAENTAKVFIYLINFFNSLNSTLYILTCFPDKMFGSNFRRFIFVISGCYTFLVLLCKLNKTELFFSFFCFFKQWKNHKLKFKNLW